MNKTAIEWCDMTWNPVTGCLHGCEYCYARGIAHRYTIPKSATGELHDLMKPYKKAVMIKGGACQNRTIAYPFEFDPTFHRYRLNEPAKLKKPQRIFVCSMADLFGEWVPDEWIAEVFRACEAAPWHQYMFLTKNPRRFRAEFIDKQPDNWWFGSTVTGIGREDYVESRTRNCFLSIEPLMDHYTPIHPNLKWIIVGAETGNRKGKIIPKREWIQDIVDHCRDAGVPVFMKNSLAEVWGAPLIQEWPEGLKL